jgi:hypothetical protein
VDDLRRALTANKPAVLEALKQARSDLEDCHAHCRELERLIANAEAVLGMDVDRGSAEDTAPHPTLRSAIRAVLKDAGRPLSAPEIARRIRDGGLYHRPNGTAVDVGQIHNRAHHYPDEFVRENGRFRLGR